jgi:uncharacterized protein YidB (DUF937 family)
MGLLDRIIGGVINSRMGGGGMSGGMGRSSGGGTSPLMMALMALLSSGALSGSGGLGGLLGGLTGGGESPGDRDGRRGRSREAETSGGGALGGLLESLTRSGHGDVADSWVGSGPNRRIEPDQLDNALGRDTIDRLQRETGMERGDLLSQLSDVLAGRGGQAHPARAAAERRRDVPLVGEGP